MLGVVSNAATVTVFVNSPPHAVNNYGGVDNLGKAITISVLGNDFDADGSLFPATVKIVSPPANGQVVANMNGTITYTPGTTLGNDTFTYTVLDNLGAVSNTATVTVLVNAAPTAVNDSAFTTTGKAVTIDVLANDTDVGSTIDPSTVTIVNKPASGSAIVNTNGQITYTPGSVLGDNTFTYTVKNPRGDISNPATVTVFVDAPPVVAGDSATTRPGSP